MIYHSLGDSNDKHGTNVAIVIVLKYDCYAVAAHKHSFIEGEICNNSISSVVTLRTDLRNSNCAIEYYFGKQFGYVLFMQAVGEVTLDSQLQTISNVGIVFST